MMRYALFLPAMFVALLLGACAHQPPAVGTGPQSRAAGSAASPAGPNPYLEGRGTVPDAAQRQFEQAQARIDARQWQDALRELQALTQAYPELSGPALNLALVYQQTGDPGQAQHWFLQSLSINPDNIAAYNEYGIFLRKQGRFREAETVYLQALDRWAGCADTHLDIGILYDLYLGERDKALQHYRRYQSLTGEQDRVVAGWITDLEHQEMAVATGRLP